MIDSILTSTKRYIGLTESYEAFDEQIIMLINTAMFNLSEACTGFEEGFEIEDDLATWDDYLPDSKRYSVAKHYIWAYVQLNFDPPTNSTLLENLKSKMEESLWRLNRRTECDNIEVKSK